MRVSTKGRYALRLMLDLAENQHKGYVPLKDIARRQKISTKYLEQIVSLLCKADYLEGVRGPQGGYKLKRAAEDYNVGEILHATEGRFTPTECLAGHTHKCNMAGQCAAVKFWEGLQNIINEYIHSYKLSDLIEEGYEDEDI